MIADGLIRKKIEDEYLKNHYDDFLLMPQLIIFTVVKTLLNWSIRVQYTAYARFVVSSYKWHILNLIAVDFSGNLFEKQTHYVYSNGRYMLINYITSPGNIKCDSHLAWLM